MSVRARRLAVALPIVLATIAAGRTARAYRPFDGTDADVAAYGEYELELAPAGFYRQGGRRFLVAPHMINNYGVVPGSELVLEIFHIRQLDGAGSPRSSLTQPQLFLKTVLREGSVQGGSGLSVASEIGPYFPEVNVDSTGLGGQIGIIISRAWRDVEVHLNIVNYLTRTHHYGLFTGLIVEGPWRWTVRPVMELLADREYDSTNFRTGLTRSVLGGLIWAVAEGFDFDAAFRVGAVDDESLQELRVGFTWTFQVVAHPEKKKD
jgi:hypothetical protein